MSKHTCESVETPNQLMQDTVDEVNSKALLNHMGKLNCKGIGTLIVDADRRWEDGSKPFKSMDAITENS